MGQFMPTMLWSVRAQATKSEESQAKLHAGPMFHQPVGKNTVRVPALTSKAKTGLATAVAR